MSGISPVAGIDLSARPHPNMFDLTGPEDEDLLEYEVLSGAESVRTADSTAGGNDAPGEQT